jgi:hypothetical protein
MRKEHWKMLPKLVRLLLGGRNGVYLDNLIQAIRGMQPSEGGAGSTLRRVGVYEGRRVERPRFDYDKQVKRLGPKYELEAKSVVIKSDWW